MLVGGGQSIVSAQTLSTPDHRGRHNRIVGLWDTQIAIYDCSTGAELFSFLGLHKYEQDGTAQVVPATNPRTRASGATFGETTTS